MPFFYIKGKGYQSTSYLWPQGIYSCIYILAIPYGSDFKQLGACQPMTGVFVVKNGFFNSILLFASFNARTF